jgi:hypothetical protein
MKHAVLRRIFAQIGICSKTEENPDQIFRSHDLPRSNLLVGFGNIIFVRTTQKF